MKKTFFLKWLPVLFIFVGLVFFRESKPVFYVRQQLLKGLVVTNSIKKIWQKIDPRNDYADLLAEKDIKIKTLEFQLEESIRNNVSLENALLLKKNKDFNFIHSSRVLFYAKDFGREFMIIDQGASGGLKKGDLVIDETGVLMGVVQDVQEDSSKVDVVYNPGRSFEVELRGLGIKSLAEGLGGGAMALKLIPAGTKLKQGDKVSLSGVKFKPILIGEVSEVTDGGTFLNVLISSLAKPLNANSVFIISF